MSINKFGYQNLPIYKVNYYINKNEFIKYIFIGERDKNIKNILNKLEKGYNNISNSDWLVFNFQMFESYYQKKCLVFLQDLTLFYFLTSIDDTLDTIGHNNLHFHEVRSLQIFLLSEVGYTSHISSHIT